MLNDLANFFQIVGFPLAILALFLGWQQLRNAARTSRVQMLLTLDASLADFDDVRTKINAGIQDIDRVRLRRYIAVFERVGLALKDKQITLEQVDRYYGARIVRLTKRKDTRDIVKNREGWKDFHYLQEAYDAYKEKLPGCRNRL